MALLELGVTSALEKSTPVILALPYAEMEGGGGREREKRKGRGRRMDYSGHERRLGNVCLTCVVSTNAAAHSLGWMGISVVYCASPDVCRDKHTHTLSQHTT